MMFSCQSRLASLMIPRILTNQNNECRQGQSGMYSKDYRRGLQVKNGILLIFLCGFGHHGQNGQFIHKSIFFLTSPLSLRLSLAVDIMDICHGSEYSGQSKYDLFCVLPALFPTLMIPALTSLVSGTSKCACYSKLVGKEYFQCFQIN